MENSKVNSTIGMFFASIVIILLMFNGINARQDYYNHKYYESQPVVIQNWPF